MSELFKVKDERLGEYEELILEKANLERKSEEIYSKYLQEFGKLEIERYETYLECLKYREMITYCQRKVNREEIINQYLMEREIQEKMSKYYGYLEDLIHDKECSENTRSISYLDILQLKKAYRHIMKLLHPDLHPQLFQKEGIKELYEKSIIDYRNNRVEEVVEDETLAVMKTKQYEGVDATDIKIVDLEEKIDKLKKEIEDIRKNPPFTYEMMLLDDDLKKEHKEELQQDIQSQKTYLGVLQDRLKAFNIVEA